MRQWGFTIAILGIFSMAQAQEVPTPCLLDTLQVKDTWWGGQRYACRGDYLRRAELRSVLENDRKAHSHWKKGQWWHIGSLAAFSSCLWMVHSSQPNWSWAALGTSVIMQGIGYGQKERAVEAYNRRRSLDLMRRGSLQG